MRSIPSYNLASHKAKVRSIAHDLNKSWSDTLHAWFSICDIREAHYDLWGDGMHLVRHYDVLREFHCLYWKHIGSEGKAEIVKHVLAYMETPYLGYQGGKFVMIDREAVAAENTRKAEERVRKEAEFYRRAALPWYHRLYLKLFGESV